MKSQHTFPTRTLGLLYLNQGYLDDAGNVFKKLIENDPQNEELQSVLHDIEQRIMEKKKTDVQDLIRVWAGLLREEKKVTVREGEATLL